MIGYLTGTVAGRLEDGCYLEVGGVGYRLACSSTTLRALPSEGAPFRLWTYLHVREDVLALFGFATEDERRTFEALLSVTGVGPRVALSVCSVLAPDALRRALVTGDVDAIGTVPGIGKKTAQRIVLELKEKLSLPDLEPATAASDPVNKARSALENLGYSPGEVRAALAEVGPPDDERVEDVVRSALKVLA